MCARGETRIPGRQTPHDDIRALGWRRSQSEWPPSPDACGMAPSRHPHRSLPTGPRGRLDAWRSGPAFQGPGDDCVTEGLPTGQGDRIGYQGRSHSQYATSETTVVAPRTISAVRQLTVEGRANLATGAGTVARGCFSSAAPRQPGAPRVHAGSVNRRPGRAPGLGRRLVLGKAQKEPLPALGAGTAARGAGVDPVPRARVTAAALRPRRFGRPQAQIANA